MHPAVSGLGRRIISRVESEQVQNDVGLALVEPRIEFVYIARKRVGICERRDSVGRGQVELRAHKTADKPPADDFVDVLFYHERGRL